MNRTPSIPAAAPSWYDVLEPARGNVAHLSHRAPGTWGHWYALCGRVVPSWRVDDLDATDCARVCTACTAKAARRRRP